MAPPASRRSVVAVEVRASESGPVLRGVILQEGRAATGGRAEVFSPGAVHWPDDGIALRLQHLGPEAARALPRRDPNGELYISTPSTPEILRAIEQDGRRYLKRRIPPGADHHYSRGRARASARVMMVTGAALVTIPVCSQATAEIRSRLRRVWL